MKLKLTLFVLTIFSLQTFAQVKNNIAFVYGIGSSTININKGVYGDVGYDKANATVAGLSFSKTVTNIFSVETGIFYSNNSINGNSFSTGKNIPFNYQMQLITIPALAKLSFLKFLYVDGGATIDFETGNRSEHQSGIGLELGLGGIYSLKKICLFANPYLQEHRIAGFNGTTYQHLSNAGFKFGLGYNL